MALFELRNSIENPAVPLSGENLLKIQGLFNNSDAGIPVDRDNLMTFSAAFQALTLFGFITASLPLKVYRRIKEGKEPYRDHPAYELVHRRANPEMTAFDVRSSLMIQKLVHGVSYAAIERNFFTREPVAIYPLLSYATKVERRKSDGRLVIVTRNERKKITIEMDLEDVLIFKNVSTDGHKGIGLLDVATNAVGLALATERFGSSFFSNGATPSGVLTFDKKFKSVEDVELQRKKWNTVHGGPDNQQKVAIIDQGGDYKAIGIPPDKAQFLETRKIQVTELARFVNLPTHFLNDLERATFSNVEHLDLAALKYSFNPHLVNQEQEMDWKLLNEEDKKLGGAYIEHSVEGLLRADTAGRAALYKTLREVTAMTGNEIRALENRNTRPDGDDLHVPMNWTPAKLSGKKNE